MKKRSPPTQTRIPNPKFPIFNRMTEEMPIEFWQGIEQFNSQEFYACHDTLEALWMEAGDPEKRFYQGILQIAVALYHLGNQNWRGAVILLGEGINRLSYYQPSYAGIAVEDLLGQSAKLLSALQQAGPEKVAEFVPLLTGKEVNGLQLPRILKVEQIQHIPSL